MHGMGRNIMRSFWWILALALICGCSLVGSIVYFLVSKASC